MECRLTGFPNSPEKEPPAPWAAIKSVKEDASMGRSVTRMDELSRFGIVDPDQSHSLLAACPAPRLSD